VQLSGVVAESNQIIYDPAVEGTDVVKRHLRSFSTLVPLFAMTLTSVVFFALALSRYYYFKHIANGRDTIHLTAGGLALTKQSAEFMHFAVLASSARLNKPIVLLHAPGHFGALAVSYLAYRQPFGQPGFLAGRFGNASLIRCSLCQHGGLSDLELTSFLDAST
jgi:hypothetical protein